MNRKTAPAPPAAGPGSAAGKRAKRTTMVPAPPPAERSVLQRSRVTNGSALFLSVESLSPQSQAGRRFADLYDLLCQDAGGFDSLTEGQRQLCRRAATLSLHAEMIEARLVAGQAAPEELDSYPRITMALGKVLTLIGLKRPVADGSKARVIDGHAAAILALGGGQCP